MIKVNTYKQLYVRTYVLKNILNTWLATVETDLQIHHIATPLVYAQTE